MTAVSNDQVSGCSVSLLIHAWRPPSTPLIKHGHIVKNFGRSPRKDVATKTVIVQTKGCAVMCYHLSL